ncbi:MAG: methyltransferase [Acidobacteria bacterium]|nr:methyltransferase [Acidobacteriota bacterium]
MSQTPPAELPPNAILLQLAFGKAITCSLSAVARLGIADHMTAEPRPVDAIAASAGVHADSLNRVLRMLASLGVFQEAPGPAYGLTPMGNLLRTDAEGSMRNFLTMFGDRWTMGAYRNVDQCIRTGGDGVTREYGKHAFEVFKDSPAEGLTFANAMTDFSRAAAEAVVPVMDLSGFNKLADVGGSHGVLLASLMDAYPSLEGVLFDLPEIIDSARASGELSRHESRVAYEGGDFFARVPAGCDAYVMKHIVHDWSDEACATILRLMRDELAKTAPATGRVFLCEMVLNENPAPSPAKMLDIEMLVCTVGGRERTASGFAALFESAGLELVTIRPTPSPVCVIEARVKA